MQKIIKLSDVFARYAGVLHMRADMGREFSVLVCNTDMQAVPETFETYKDANDKVTALNRRGITASVCRTIPYSKRPELGYRLYCKPVTGFSSYPDM